MFRGDLTLHDIENMSRRKLLAMVEARVEALKKDGGKEESMRMLEREMR